MRFRSWLESDSHTFLAITRIDPVGLIFVIRLLKSVDVCNILDDDLAARNGTIAMSKEILRSDTPLLLQPLLGTCNLVGPA
jgi:hypothetical protein